MLVIGGAFEAGFSRFQAGGVRCWWVKIMAWDYLNGLFEFGRKRALQMNGVGEYWLVNFSIFPSAMERSSATM